MKSYEVGGSSSDCNSRDGGCGAKKAARKNKRKISRKVAKFLAKEKLLKLDKKETFTKFIHRVDKIKFKLRNFLDNALKKK